MKTCTIRHMVLAAVVFGFSSAFAQPLPANALQQTFHLQFKDFFSTPMGSKGAEMSHALLQADGKLVRLTGYMVRQEMPTPGRFMLTPRPVHMSEHADGEADDLPPAWVMVYLDPGLSNYAVTHVMGLLEVSGVLSVGRYEESDGRVSWVRMQLPPESTRGMNTFELAGYFHSLQHKH